MLSGTRSSEFTPCTEVGLGIGRSVRLSRGDHHDNGMDCQNTGGAEVCVPQWDGALFRPGLEPALHAHRCDGHRLKHVGHWRGRTGRRLLRSARVASRVSPFRNHACLGFRSERQCDDMILMRPSRMVAAAPRRQVGNFRGSVSSFVTSGTRSIGYEGEMVARWSRDRCEIRIDTVSIRSWTTLTPNRTTLNMTHELVINA
jgi:hypothetical protein